jgi:hypothetical protein
MTKFSNPAWKNLGFPISNVAKLTTKAYIAGAMPKRNMKARYGKRKA